MGRRGDAPRARAKSGTDVWAPRGGRVARARGGAGRNGTHRPARPTPRLGESRERATRVELPEPRARTAAPRSRARRCDEKPRPRAERASAMVVARDFSDRQHNPSAAPNCASAGRRFLLSMAPRNAHTDGRAPRSRSRRPPSRSRARCLPRATPRAWSSRASTATPRPRCVAPPPRVARRLPRAGARSSADRTVRLRKRTVAPSPPPPRRARLRGPSRPRARPSGTSGASIALPVPASAAGGDRVFPRPRTPEALPGSASDVFFFLTAPRTPRARRPTPPPPAAALDVPFPSPAPHPLVPPPLPAAPFPAGRPEPRATSPGAPNRRAPFRRPRVGGDFHGPRTPAAPPGAEFIRPFSFIFGRLLLRSAALSSAAKAAAFPVQRRRDLALHPVRLRLQEPLAAVPPRGERVLPRRRVPAAGRLLPGPLPDALEHHPRPARVRPRHQRRQGSLRRRGEAQERRRREQETGADDRDEAGSVRAGSIRRRRFRARRRANARRGIGKRLGKK